MDRRHVAYIYNTKATNLESWRKLEFLSYCPTDSSTVIWCSAVQRLSDLLFDNLPTLKYRRHREDMIEVYKILHGIYFTDISHGILQLAQDNRTRGHSLKLVTQHSKTEIRRNCFSVRVVKPWNALPEFVVSSRNIQTFESRLDKAWENQPVRFCYKEELQLWLWRSGHRGLIMSCVQYHR